MAEDENEEIFHIGPPVPRESPASKGLPVYPQVVGGWGGREEDLFMLRDPPHIANASGHSREIPDYQFSYQVPNGDAAAIHRFYAEALQSDGWVVDGAEIAEKFNSASGSSSSPFKSKVVDGVEIIERRLDGVVVSYRRAFCLPNTSRKLMLFVFDGVPMLEYFPMDDWSPESRCAFLKPFEGISVMIDLWE